MVKQYDTQEILWGDLLHTDNIAQAYAVTNRPAELDLMKIMYRERKELANETEDDYSGDGEIDAGETVSLYPVIRTTFGAASNIQMKLEMGDEYEDPNTVEILTPGWVNFGLPLSAYGKGVSLNPMQLKVASNVADNRHIKMKFTAKCDETNTLYEGHFTMVVNNMVKINGLISEDRTLKADHVYLVNDNIGIMEGVTLTIEPGTRLEFMEGMGISSFGKLVANGTPEKPIVFTGHNGAVWAGVNSHRPTGSHNHECVLYTNDLQTLFTLLPTELTPIKFESNYKTVYYSADEGSPHKNFHLSSYMEDSEYPLDMTYKQEMLTDPNYLTPAVLQMLNEWEAYWSQYPTEYSDDKPISSSIEFTLIDWCTYDNPRDIISYCRIDGYNADSWDLYHPQMMDCVITPAQGTGWCLFNGCFSGVRNNLLDVNCNNIQAHFEGDLRYWNIINNYSDGGLELSGGYIPEYKYYMDCNFFNNFFTDFVSGKYYNKSYLCGTISSSPLLVKLEKPSYLGSSKEAIIRPYLFEIGNASGTYGQIDLSNMRTTPVAEAHGIVWKVVVNGYDAQDEYDQLPPLGVGKHKFEVYFNRPMNKAVAPQISFGVRDPWTQNAVAEEGEGSGWNAEGTIYTAYKTITGRTKSDGVNRIYVRGAEDNEYFEIPYEKTRFNVMINAAGSMATGFAAEAGMGRVNLTWDNSHNDFEDAMGFNIYRYELDNEGNEVNTTRLNQEIVDIETEDYTDYNVVPGTTYYYIYKVLSTDLQEYDVSNVVAATPLTSTLGDANGSGDVNVTDVVWTVNYAVGMDPKPFIFEAADVNKDQAIDILDVVGIVNLAMSAARPMTRDEAVQAVYTIEDGILYVETPISLAGLQVQLSVDNKIEMKAADGLKGFEQASTWLTDNDYMLMAYNFGKKTLEPGKHALLYIGDAELTDIRVSDIAGQKVNVVPGTGTTAIDGTLLTKTLNKTGIYNLNGQKVAGNADRKLQHGVYIINGQKVVK